MPYADKQVQVQYWKDYYQKNRKAILMKEKIRKSTSEQKRRKAEYDKKRLVQPEVQERNLETYAMRRADPEWVKRKAAYGEEWRKRLRLEVLVAYSGDLPKCACCGESHTEFLALDHVHPVFGKGRRRRTYKDAGQILHGHLKKLGFPSGYRVLCHNCNSSLGFYGYCPHDKEKKN